MPLYLFYTMVQKSQKWPKTQIKGHGNHKTSLTHAKKANQTELWKHGTQDPLEDRTTSTRLDVRIQKVRPLPHGKAADRKSRTTDAAK